mmetsp:Transcript_47849/g.132947  ORF Transcript_47849/g.132947 Transcript_47849/m.132947 type:complete len:172 (-) Transcript_47849:19-534(-)
MASARRWTNAWCARLIAASSPAIHTARCMPRPYVYVPTGRNFKVNGRPTWPLQEPYGRIWTDYVHKERAVMLTKHDDLEGRWDPSPVVHHLQWGGRASTAGNAAARPLSGSRPARSDGFLHRSASSPALGQLAALGPVPLAALRQPEFGFGAKPPRRGTQWDSGENYYWGV